MNSRNQPGQRPIYQPQVEGRKILYLTFGFPVLILLGLLVLIVISEQGVKALPKVFEELFWKEAPKFYLPLIMLALGSWWKGKKLGKLIESDHSEIYHKSYGTVFVPLLMYGLTFFGVAFLQAPPENAVGIVLSLHVVIVILCAVAAVLLNGFVLIAVNRQRKRLRDMQEF